MLFCVLLLVVYYVGTANKDTQFLLIDLGAFSRDSRDEYKFRPWGGLGILAHFIVHGRLGNVLIQYSDIVI